LRALSGLWAYQAASDRHRVALELAQKVPCVGRGAARPERSAERRGNDRRLAALPRRPVQRAAPSGTYARWFTPHQTSHGTVNLMGPGALAPTESIRKRQRKRGSIRYGRGTRVGSSQSTVQHSIIGRHNIVGICPPHIILDFCTVQFGWIRRSIDLCRQSDVSHQSLGSAVSIGTTCGQRVSLAISAPFLVECKVRAHPIVVGGVFANRWRRCRSPSTTITSFARRKRLRFSERPV
jgi:hypothetical protein